MKSTFISCALALGLVLTPQQTLMAQHSLPNLGDDTGMSLGAERLLGDKISREIYADNDYVSDPILDAYLAKLWLPLMASARQRGELSPEMQDAFAWKLFLIRDKSVNAFALPGAYFGVHLGLMALVETPDELASVLAHELTHVTQRHIARGMSKQAAATPFLVAGIIAGLLAARSNANIANAVLSTAQAGAIQNQLNFTRDMEREADRIGFTLMQGAGYAPSSFVAMFNKLGLASRFSDNSFPYLRSHPLSAARVAEMTQRVGEFDHGTAMRNTTTSSQSGLLIHSLMAARAKVLANLSIDAQKQHVAQADALALGGAQSAAATLPVLYAGALAANQLKDAPKAQTLYAKLVTLTNQAIPAVLEGQALVRWMGAELGLPVQLNLQSDVRAEMLLAAKQVMTTHPQAVTNRLRTWVSIYPQDADAWRVLSTVYVAQNQRVRAAMADAQSKSASQDDSAALAGYQAAQSLIRQGLPADSVDSAVVDSKVRELQRRVRERLP